jgi:hypothetical protein
VALDNSSYFKDHGSVDGTYTSSASRPSTLIPSEKTGCNRVRLIIGSYMPVIWPCDQQTSRTEGKEVRLAGNWKE